VRRMLRFRFAAGFAVRVRHTSPVLTRHSFLRCVSRCLGPPFRPMSVLVQCAGRSLLLGSTCSWFLYSYCSLEPQHADST
jgi:hypothetical protein